MIIVNSRFLTQPITGVQRYAIEISLQLKKIFDGSIIFVAPHNIIQEELASKLEVKIIGKNVGHLWEQVDLPLFLKQNNSPLLLCLANTAPLFYKNKISTIHDVAFKVYPKTFSKKFLYSYLLIIPLIIKSSKHILTVSNFSKTEIQKYYHTEPENISVIYNAVNNEFTYINNENLNHIPYFLAVSSVNYRKNFYAVLKAFNLFKKQSNSSKYKLYIIGDMNSDSFKGLDLSAYKNNPDIVFCGRVTDKELINYYSNAIGFIYPSLYEGFGIPPLEAQACKCPVLSSDISPLIEVLEKSALYADPFNIEDIASKMEMLKHEKLRDELISLGQENIKRFSWNKSANQLKEIILKFI